MHVKDILKRNIPSFQSQSESLIGYLDAAGEFLEDTKEAITQFDYSDDYKNSTEYQLENALLDRGYSIPSRIKQETKRKILRDVAEIFLKNGTQDGIEHAISIAGKNPAVESGWIVAPRSLRKGWAVDPVTQARTRYEVNNLLYVDLLYGEEVVTDDGVFFQGYKYRDKAKQDLIGPLPIMGERYTNTPENWPPVAKSPYMVVYFDDANLTLVTDVVIDPETGAQYSYSFNEEFQLLTDVLNFFLVKTNRPTTTRIILVVFRHILDDEIDLDENFEEDFTVIPDPYTATDSTTISETYDEEYTVAQDDLFNDDFLFLGETFSDVSMAAVDAGVFSDVLGTVSELFQDDVQWDATVETEITDIETVSVFAGNVTDPDPMLVGGPVMIGNYMPYVNQFSVIEAPLIGGTIDSPEVHEWPYEEAYTYHRVGYTPFDIATRGVTTISFTGPYGGATVYGLENTSSTPVSLGAVDEDAYFEFTSEGQYQLIRIVYNTPLIEDVPILVAYHAFDQTPE